MAAEDEAVGLVIKVGDTVVQGASELFMLILRALAKPRGKEPPTSPKRAGRASSCAASTA